MLSCSESTLAMVIKIVEADVMNMSVKFQLHRPPTPFMVFEEMIFFFLVFFFFFFYFRKFHISVAMATS